MIRRHASANSTVRRLCLLACFFLLSQYGSGQTIDRMFAGTWADTRWLFIFKKDGTCKRISSGHYGNTTVSATYKMRRDTLELTSDISHTNRTVNRFYLIDSSGMLIDLWLRYDYAPYHEGKRWMTPSSIRKIKYPQLPARDSVQPADLRRMLTETLSLDTLGRFFGAAAREPVLQNYYALNDSTCAPITAGGRTFSFLPREKISADPYIEIEDVNMNPDEVEIRMLLHNGKQQRIWQTYYKVGQEWVAGWPLVF